MSEYIKHIIVTLSITIFFVLEFLGPAKIVYTANAFNPNQYSYQIETPTNTESGKSQTPSITKRLPPLVCKVQIQSWAIIVSRPFESLQEYIILKTSIPYQLSPHISYIRYLPRDPPTA